MVFLFILYYVPTILTILGDINSGHNINKTLSVFKFINNYFFDLLVLVLLIATWIFVNLKNVFKKILFSKILHELKSIEYFWCIGVMMKSGISLKKALSLMRMSVGIISVVFMQMF